MLTLIEAAKLIQNPLQRGVVEVFPRTSPVLQYLPFLQVNGNAYSYNLEETLPGVAFRGINETYTESTGIVNPCTEALKIFGGTSRVDRALVKTQGNVNSLRAVEDGMKAKAAALDFTKTFFKGDNQTDPRQFDGLQKRITGPQLIPAGNSAGGDALSLILLDELLDQVQGGADALFMNKTMRRRLTQAARTTGVSGFITYQLDAFGRQVAVYNGIPIHTIDVDAEGNEILGFNEAAPGGGTPNCSSIYAVKFGVKEFVSGLQAGELEVIDQGLVDVWYQTLIEWIVSIAVFNPRSAARLLGINNSAVVA